MILTENMPKDVTLVGNPDVLEEKTPRSENYREMDTIPESSVVYLDLVFTLGCSFGKYLRPKVIYEQEKLKVVSNNDFYKAIKDSGIQRIKFDLLLDRNVPLEKLMEDFSLEFPHPPVRKEYLERFLFFMGQPKYFSNDNPLVIPNPNNPSANFLNQNCLAYKILLETPEKTQSIEHELVARLFNENGHLRSIDGLRDKSGILGKYIS